MATSFASDGDTPFERYFSDTQSSSQPSSSFTQNPASYGYGFDVPQFMQGLPTLAPGGGAEVLPAGYFSGSKLNWIDSNSFS